MCLLANCVHCKNVSSGPVYFSFCFLFLPSNFIQSVIDIQSCILGLMTDATGGWGLIPVLIVKEERFQYGSCLHSPKWLLLVALSPGASQ